MVPITEAVAQGPGSAWSRIKEFRKSNNDLVENASALNVGMWAGVGQEAYGSWLRHTPYPFPNIHVFSPTNYYTFVHSQTSIEIAAALAAGNLAIMTYSMFEDRIIAAAKRAFRRGGDDAPARETALTGAEREGGRSSFGGKLLFGASAAVFAASLRATNGIAGALEAGRHVYSMSDFLGIDPPHAAAVLTQLAWQDAFVGIAAGGAIGIGYSVKLLSDHANYKSRLAEKASAAKKYLIAGGSAAFGYLAMRLDMAISGASSLHSVPELTAALVACTGAISIGYLAGAKRG